MKILYQKKGLTLIEIIVALAILGIVVTTFIGAFSNGFTTILAMGNKTQAVSEAQGVLDSAYLNIGSLTAYNDAGIDDLDEGLYNPLEPSKRIFYKNTTETIDGTAYNKVTVLVFYQKGKRFIKQTALIP